MRRPALSLLLFVAVAALAASPEVRPRIRDLGVTPGIFSPGRSNAITDVEGVRVGHRTLVRGESVRTGVTAILPHGGNLFQEKVPAAVYVGNGFGKAAGFLQIQELGNLETPIVLTNTLAVGTAIEAVVAWTLEQPGNETVRSVNAVVGETQRRRPQRHPGPARHGRRRARGDHGLRIGSGRGGKRATDVAGHAGNRGEAIPIDRLRELLHRSLRP